MQQLDRATVEHVLRAMEHADVTVDVLATRTGIPESTLRRRLAATTSFTVRELGLMARALDCRTWELVGEQEIAPAEIAEDPATRPRRCCYEPKTTIGAQA